MPEHSNSEEAPQLTQTVEEQIEIITFDDDQAIVEQPVPNEIPIPKIPGIAHTDFHNHSVLSFLKRPQLLSSFRWRTSDMRSANLYRLSDGNVGGLLIPTHLIARRMARNKLDGFTSFKATAVIELLVNAQPFQCGRLLMAAAPMPSLLGHRKDFIFSHVSNTQNIQHVQMDVAKDTKVTLKIPFISPYSCFDLIDGKFDWAELRILVYSPLRSVAGDCVECNVYGHFEDIELGAPTSGEMPIQQSTSPGAVERGRKKESTGRLTGALSAIGNTLVSKSLSTVSPLLSVGDSILAAAGWAKPILSKPSQVVLNRPEEGFAYMDGVDQSLVLGMTASNAVDSIPNLVGTGIDETDFHRLKRIPQMIGAFTYSNNITGIPTCSSGSELGTPVPRLLWSCAVAPTCNVPACYNVTVPPDATNNIVNPYTMNWKQPTTLNYISSPFLYWTGSLVYTFKFVKTDFHSGRVEISFHPFINNLAPSATWLADRMDYVYRTVIDLRKNSEVSVTIPYIAAQPWKRVSTYLDPINPTPPAPGRAKDLITGMLAVRALTPLFSTATVTPSIEVLVEMRAGDDYEVQGPITSKFLPFSFGNVDFPQTITAIQQSASLHSVDLPVEQSASLRTSAISRQIYFSWDSTNEANRRITISGLEGVRMLRFDIYLTVTNWRRNPTSWDFNVQLSWDAANPSRFMSNGTDYQDKLSFTVANPANIDDLVINVIPNNINPTIERANTYVLLDIFAYPVTQTASIVQIDSTQIPLPVTSMGGSGVVRIDSSQFPLPVQPVVASDSPPYPVFVTNDTHIVKIDESQVPLSVAFQEGENAVTMKIDESQIPLSVSFDRSEPVRIEIDESQIPLPTTSSGGGAGGTVSINPDQLPLWVSEFNIAPMDPRAPTPVKVDAVQQSASDKLATSGITETRTSAMEGWMPPCISGNEEDAHRPSTAQWCAGERFTSFRQYTRRFAFCLVAGLNSSRMMKVQPVELVRPGILALRPTAGTAPGNDRTQYALYAPNTRAEVSGSPLSFVAGMYAFYRGSVRFKAWMDPRENPPNLISGHLEYSRQLNDTNIIDDNIENFMTPIMYETPNQKQIAEFQVPYYSPTIVSSTWSHGVDSQFDIPLCNLVLSIPDFRATVAVNFPIKVAVAAGDDMDFHQFIGPPPVINVGDILTTGRSLHYPPTGFTPTQKIVTDTARTDEPATRFVRVPWNRLTVSGNPNGGPCPMPTPTSFVPTVRQTRDVKFGPGKDEVG